MRLIKQALQTATRARDYTEDMFFSVYNYLSYVHSILLPYVHTGLDVDVVFFNVIIQQLCQSIVI